MLKLSYLLFLTLLANTLFSQVDSLNIDTNNLVNEENKKYIAWVSPSSATHVNGLMFNFLSKSLFYDNPSFPKINGIELSLDPLALFVSFPVAIHSILPVQTPPIDYSSDHDFKKDEVINGLRLGTGSFDPAFVNGAAITFTGTYHSKINGVVISAIINKNYIVNGVTIGGMGNYDVKCRGVQIGLFNKCDNLRGFQIGLWNKNQKRSLPIINWSFRNKAKKSIKKK